MTKQCIEIIEYDLKNQYAVIGDTMIKFHLGIPMGKSASPPIANILAIFQMEQFYNWHMRICKYLCILNHFLVSNGQGNQITTTFR